MTFPQPEVQPQDPGDESRPDDVAPVTDPQLLAELSRFEDPQVTAAFAALADADHTAKVHSGKIKVSHLVVIVLVLAALPALAIWALTPGT